VTRRARGAGRARSGVSEGRLSEAPDAALAAAAAAQAAADVVAGASPLPRGDALRLVILDCDGVLFDSWRANVAFYDAVLARVGLPALDADGRRLCHTLASPQLFARLADADPDVLAALTAAAREVDYGPFYELMVPAHGLAETLARLAAHCPLALATNRGRTAREVLVRFDVARFFAVQVGVLDVARPKPAPDLLVACLAHTGIAADAAVYVGDTELDRAAAAAAGVAYVGVGAESGAARRIDALAELPALLLGDVSGP